MELKLTKKELFTVEENKRIGNMRFDWADGKLANSWSPTKVLSQINKDDIKELQKELNELLFEKLNTLDKAIELCNGEGYSNETIFFTSSEKFNYGIRIIPTLETNSIIYCFLK